jgi:hypothetical protein
MLIKGGIVTEVESIAIARSSIYALIDLANDPDTATREVVNIHKYLVDTLGKNPMKQEVAPVINIQLDSSLGDI